MITTAVGIRFELSVVNGWFIREFARAFVSVGGVEHEVVWRRETVIAVTPGATDVAVYFRYRGSRTALGTAPAEWTWRPAKRCIWWLAMAY